MNKTRILVVDDSDIALEAARTDLESAGFEVNTYADSLGIQAYIRKTQPEVVLLDVRMPALSGDRICEMLKKNPDTRDMLVILFSSLSPEELEAMVEASGADGFVAKTEAEGNLARAVRAVMEATKIE